MNRWQIAAWVWTSRRLCWSFEVISVYSTLSSLFSSAHYELPPQEGDEVKDLSFARCRSNLWVHVTSNDYHKQGWQHWWSPHIFGVVESAISWLDSISLTVAASVTSWLLLPLTGVLLASWTRISQEDWEILASRCPFMQMNFEQRSNQQHRRVI